MIYFYYGTDIDKARTKAHELIDSLRKKKPEASFFKLDGENFNEAALEEYVGGQGLFTNKYIVFLDRLCEKKEEYSAFALADAFGKRNKKDAWILYRKAIDRGEAAEALHGMLFWKVKTMILSGGSVSWKKEELYQVLDELVTLYHESRRGNGELETRLEAFLVGMK